MSAKNNEITYEAVPTSSEASETQIAVVGTVVAEPRAPVVAPAAAAAVAPREWQTGLFDCFDDLGSFFEGLCCTELQIAMQLNSMTKVREYVVEPNGSVMNPLSNSDTAEDGCLSGFWNMNPLSLLCMIGGNILLHAPLCTLCFTSVSRSMVQRRYNIQPNLLVDVAAALCCTACAVAQQHREMTLAGEFPGSILSLRDRYRRAVPTVMTMGGAGSPANAPAAGVAWPTSPAAATDAPAPAVKKASHEEE